MTLSGGTVYPESAEKGVDIGSFIVHYSDGSSQLYHSTGGLNEREATDAPGRLTYVRDTRIGYFVFFEYTYTEEGITTEEFTLMTTNIDFG